MSENIQNQELKSKILSVFNEIQKGLNGESSSAINQIRTAAAESFAKNGFPTLKHENWKYTNLSFVKKQDFEIAGDSIADDIKFENIKNTLPLFENAVYIAFVNGRYVPGLSDFSNLPSAVEVLSFDEAAKNYSEKLASIFAKNARFEQNPLEAANTAISRESVFISIKTGEIVLNPILLINFTDSRLSNVYHTPRVLISAGKRSQTTFIEISGKIGDNLSFSNSVVEGVLGESAVMNYYKLLNEDSTSYSVSTDNFEVRANAVFTSGSVYLSGAFARNNLNIIMAGENAEANLDGFYYSTAKNLIDNHTFVDHAVPNCYSNEFYKGIINGESQAVFNGRILVRQDAQKTNAYQSNKNILLSSNASINTKPELEIYADDVKCSHGATTGSLDNESLFYMRARGIGTEAAKALLLNAFAAEVINRVKLPELKDYILTKVTERLLPEGSYFCELLG